MTLAGTGKFAVAAATVAFGAFAVGALAVGALAIGRLAIGRMRIRKLEVDELVVHRFRIEDPGSPELIRDDLESEAIPTLTQPVPSTHPLKARS
jgi:hypothetical protein